ncbi:MULTISPECIES: GNAT family N-acetyltransferase [unclassified Arthrobacter]|uniref:GNAT family N-acetyltransferase n=1 Tax=Micrococcaceae TaxID=1268 RepID=UPI000CFC980D|nr:MULTISPECIES: GNAT family N-acetyltransferase [unclassified Arthrobacter]PQZ87462.1 GNAT family N-acetyltransferase [Arthrobacter sp. MYb222]PRB78721.1 GNAT family N-acetyltransferase [Arthrobacter sp. MYb214]TDU27877.1 aminoglycoside 2'-N-acetyltransferase I [Arthrobacter sp. JUb115]
MTRADDSSEATILETALEIVAHAELAEQDAAELRRLFDAEYLRDAGIWDPDLPYGYAPHDFHIMARCKGEVVGHVGWARRTIGVGGRDLVVAGVGGVLVSERARGRGLGGILMNLVASSMVDAGGIAFGYLGCREEVAAFYSSCGWTRISAAERSISRGGQAIYDPAGQPLLILPIESQLASWPQGEVDLRGRAW